MSIQSSINQTLSLASLLYSQSPDIAGRRVKAEIEADEPRRKKEAEHTEKLAKIKADVELAKHEKDLEMKEQHKAQKAAEKREFAKADYESRRDMVAALNINPRMSSEDYGSSLELQRLSRLQAIEKGTAHIALSPDAEAQKNIATWRDELAQIEPEIARAQKSREDRKVSQKAIQIARSKEEAKANLQSEQERIAASRRITEGIYYSPESEKAIAEQQKIKVGGAK